MLKLLINLFKPLWNQRGQIGSGAFGGGGGGGVSNPFGTAPVPGGGFLSGHSYLPPQAQPLAKLVGQTAQQGVGNINQFAQDPYSNSLFQNSLQGILGALQPFLEQQQAGLQDQFRAAGGLRDSRFGDQMTNLLASQQQQVGGIAGNLANQVFGNLLQALMAPSQIAQGGLKAFPTLSEQFSPTQMSGGGGVFGRDTMSPPTSLQQPPSQAPTPSGGLPQPPSLPPVQVEPSVDYSVFGIGDRSGYGDSNIYYDPGTGTFHNQPTIYPGSTPLAGYGIY